MAALLCARCGALVADVTDLRFGLMPPSCLCRSCTLPAFARTRAL